MYQQPAAPRGTAARHRLLLTPPMRLGWTFRSHRALITPYGEPPPDPQAIAEQAAARLAAAAASWQRAKKWGIRPSLTIFIALIMLAGCAHAVSPQAQAGGAIVTAFVLAAPGLGWAAWRYVQYSTAKTADPRHLYQAAQTQWAGRAAGHEQAELDRVAGVPEWGSADLRTPRTDVYGGTLAGWRSLLTVHGASILARQPLLVADLTGQYALAELAALAREARVPSAEYVLPRDLDRSGLLARLSGQHLADALAEAIHAGPPGTARTDRAVDVRVLEQLCDVLARHGVTPPGWPPPSRSPSAATPDPACSPRKKRTRSAENCSATATRPRSASTWSGSTRSSLTWPATPAPARRPRRSRHTAPCSRSSRERAAPALSCSPRWSSSGSPSRSPPAPPSARP